MKDIFLEGLELYKEKKYEEAYALFSLGEKENDARCIHARGLCFWQGKGVKQNKTLGKKIVKENIARLEEDGQNNKPGANKLLHLAYSGVDFLIDNKKNFEVLLRIYENKDEAEEDFLLELARCYQNGSGVERNYVQANKLFEECIAKYNSPYAMSELSLNCFYGFTNNESTCKKDVDQGLYYLKMACDANWIFAMTELIAIYLGVPCYEVGDLSNYAEAKKQVDKLKNISEVQGQIYLSLFYALSGDFVRMGEALNEIDMSVRATAEDLYYAWESFTFRHYSRKEAVERLEKWKLACLDKLLNANPNTEHDVYTNMAFFYNRIFHDEVRYNRRYFDKKGIERLRKKNIEYYLKGIERNEEYSIFEYAKLLLEGEEVEKDEKRAFELLLKAYSIAFNGDIANHIAEMYEYGIGVSKNKRKALEYYTKASKTDNGYAWANFNLLFYYTNSKNVEDKMKVQKIERDIEKRGIDDASVNSIQNLRNSRFDGNSLKGVRLKKLFWLTEYCCKKGLDEIRLSHIADLYASGCGVKKDVKKALQLYKKDLAKGDFVAALSIGDTYYYAEEGIKKNIPLAIKYYEMGANASGWFGYANLQLFNIYFDKNSKYFDIEKAIQCLEKVPEDDEFSIGCAQYLLGHIYHESGLVKKNLHKAIEHYKRAYKFGYNCEYAIELAKNDLRFQNLFVEGKRRGLSNREARFYARREIEKNDDDNPFRQFVMKDLLSQTMTKQEKLSAIKRELQADFDDVWDDLGDEAQKALITGIYIYTAMVEVGVEYYHDLDFAPVINQFSKAYEIQLKKYFYTGFLTYLKRKKISVNEFVKPNETRQLPIVDSYYTNKKRTRVAYRYCDEQNDNVNPFSLGSLKYIITFDLASKNEYFGNEVNKHVLAYMKEIFKDDVFEYAHYDMHLRSYLLDLANDTKTIMDRRNPSAHGTFMSIDEAEVCANYLMKVKKVIYHFVSKIKEGYRGGFKNEQE